MRPLYLLGLAPALVVSGLLLSTTATAELPSYTLFESDPVNPIALSPDGMRLFAVNTHEGRLEIFRPNANGKATFLVSVPVGLEPVSVAARNNSEVWVVNHLSDSVSIVDVASDPPRVIRTLLVGDEPRGIVFAGPGGDRAFIATAHRGQNTPWPDGDFDVPGTGRADVWVFDANMLGTSLEGDPLTVVQLFGDRPRALVASPDGSTVYAAVFRSGNRTATVGEGNVCNGTGPCNIQGTTYPGGLPDPRVGHCDNDLPTACLTNSDCPGGSCIFRQTGLIVRYNESTQDWEDENGTNWSPAIRFSLPDYDVFEINANAATPSETQSFSGVGTILFNMVINPENGKLYVSNTQAQNHVRFEGAGDYVNNGTAWQKDSGDPPSVRGNLAQSHVTVIDTVGNVDPRHLNKHIPYGVDPVPAGVKEASLGTPMGMAVTSDGNTVYVAGFGSNTIGVYDTAQLENDTFVPSAANQITDVPGPTGMVIDEARGYLWVATTRHNYEIHSVNLSTQAVQQAGSWYSPEPREVKDGRKFLYDTQLTSSNGEASCSSCHIFGDMDDLAWDLGDPDADSFANNNFFAPSTEFPGLGLLAIQFPLQPFDTLKGPMTTQSLRGMAKAGPMHWRGDRTGPECETATPSDIACANRAFNEFNVAFPGLIGRDEGELDPADMQAFTDFALRLTYPPNPIRPLDNSLSPAAAQGKQQYGFNAMGDPITTPLTDTVAACRGCHALDPDQGFFGTAGFSTFENETMEFKVAHLRNMYQKVGMFGQPPSNFFPNADGTQMGDQVRGFGFLHDGSVSTAANFLSAGVFSNFNVANMEAFMMEFDSDLAPIVGQQTTVTENTGSEMLTRVDLLIARADAEYYNNVQDGSVPECDLIAKGVIGDEQRGFFYLRGTDTFQSDDPDEPESPWSKSALLAAAAQPGQALTFTCVPPGSGQRMGIDRDEDTVLDYPDTTTCSVSRIGAAGSGKLVALAFFTLVGLAVVRRRQRA